MNFTFLFNNCFRLFENLIKSLVFLFFYTASILSKSLFYVLSRKKYIYGTYPEKFQTGYCYILYAHINFIF